MAGLGFRVSRGFRGLGVLECRGLGFRGLGFGWGLFGCAVWDDVKDQGDSSVVSRVTVARVLKALLINYLNNPCSSKYVRSSQNQGHIRAPFRILFGKGAVLFWGPNKDLDLENYPYVVDRAEGYICFTGFKRGLKQKTP